MSGRKHHPPAGASRVKPLGSRRSMTVSVLDVGSTKICCLIARLKPLEPGESSEALRGRTHSIEVLGIGHQRSRGIKSGVVANLDAAEQAIRLAVDAAERMAGVTVKLPESGVREALAQLVKLNAESRLLDRDVVVVDLRLPDRITVRLPEGRSLEDVTSETGVAPHKART